MFLSGITADFSQIDLICCFIFYASYKEAAVNIRALFAALHLGRCNTMLIQLEQKSLLHVRWLKMLKKLKVLILLTRTSCCTINKTSSVCINAPIGDVWNNIHLCCITKSCCIFGHTSKHQVWSIRGYVTCVEYQRALRAMPAVECSLMDKQCNRNTWNKINQASILTFQYFSFLYLSAVINTDVDLMHVRSGFGQVGRS